MINRVLIRTKVVQLLYSYLLTEKRFTLESQPVTPTREKRFAYNLYLDMLWLMTRIADGIEKRGGEKPLAETRFIRKVLADDAFKSLRIKYGAGGFPYSRVIDRLTDTVKDSGIYKNFLKTKGPEGLADESAWSQIFNLIIVTDTELNGLFKDAENFSLKGVDRMREMMENTFTNFFTSRDNIADALRELNKSLGMARELYLSLLALPVALTRLEAMRIDDNRHKYIKTHEDLNPNMRFVDNELVRVLESNPVIESWMSASPSVWGPADHVVTDSLLKSIRESDIYREYMDFPATDYNNDCEFWRNIFKTIIFRSEAFVEYMEDKSVFWNDDLEIIGTFVLKTLKRFQDGKGDSAVLDMYKDEEDARFGAELFSDVVRNKERYKGLVDEFVNKSSWDADRLAFMDVVVVLTALAEILNFPKIPLNVSINEYIEIAKSYSTGRSGAFVNGLLGAIVESLVERGELDKR